MPAVQLVDIEGAVRVWVNAYPGLVGPANPLTNGVHLQAPRSSSRGTVAQVSVVSRTPDDTTDEARLSFAVRAVGSERGATEVAEYAARALAYALDALTRTGPQGVVVTTRRAEQVRLICAGELAGPTKTGDVGGEVTYSVDATFRAQPA